MLYRLKWPCNDEVTSKAILEDFYDSNRVWMVFRLHRNALFDIWLLLGSINQISRGGGGNSLTYKQYVVRTLGQVPKQNMLPMALTYKGCKTESRIKVNCKSRRRSKCLH